MTMQHAPAPSELDGLSDVQGMVAALAAVVAMRPTVESWFGVAQDVASDHREAHRAERWRCYCPECRTLATAGQRAFSWSQR